MKFENKCRVATGPHFYNNVIPSKERVCSVLYSCDKCVQTFTSNGIFRQHYRLAHSTEPHEHQCRIKIEINEEFKLKSYFHVQTAHSGLLQYQCTVCKKFYKSKQCLRDHVLDGHLTKPKDSHFHNRCGYCPNIYSFTKNLNAHIRNKHGFYRCPKCSMDFKSNDLLQKHRKSVHPEEENQALPSVNRCVFCQKIYCTKQYLSIHIKKMHGEGFHICSKCNAGFESEDQLQAHIKLVHSKEEHEEHNIGEEISASTQQQDVVVMKKEPADEELELGPVVLQHIDCNYRPYEEEPQLD